MSTEKINNPTPVSIVFVMDASGSMANMGNEPLQGLNAFYKKQKDSGQFTSTLVFFSNDVTFHHKNIRGEDVPVLSKSDYIIDGMTALYDAIGQSIEYQRNIKTENVIFVILTDGHENASTSYNKNSIKELITEMEEKHKWLFIYLGANQDSFSVSQGIGIRHSADYAYTPEGCCNILRTISDNVSRCVSNNIRTDNFSSEEIRTVENSTNFKI